MSIRPFVPMQVLAAIGIFAWGCCAPLCLFAEPPGRVKFKEITFRNDTPDEIVYRVSENDVELFRGVQKPGSYRSNHYFGGFHFDHDLEIVWFVGRDIWPTDCSVVRLQDMAAAVTEDGELTISIRPGGAIAVREER